MNEKILIKGKNEKASSIKIQMLIFSIGSLIMLFVLFGIPGKFEETTIKYFALFFLVPLLPCAVICIFQYFYTAMSEITVTDKRVYGTAAFGKRVDLPLDSISGISTGVFHAISVATSSSRISFVGITNREQVHKIISKLLIERQEQVSKREPPQVTQIQQIPQSNADEIKKYKELLDMGAISEEEFATKKKQLLGL